MQSAAAVANAQEVTCRCELHRDVQNMDKGEVIPSSVAARMCARGGRQEGSSETGVSALGLWSGTTGSLLVSLSHTRALGDGQVSQRHSGNFQVLDQNLLDAYHGEGCDRGGGQSVLRAGGAPNRCRVEGKVFLQGE